MADSPANKPYSAGLGPNGEELALGAAGDLTALAQHPRTDQSFPSSAKTPSDEAFPSRAPMPTPTHEEQPPQQQPEQQQQTPANHQSACAASSHDKPSAQLLRSQQPEVCCPSILPSSSETLPNWALSDRAAIQPQLLLHEEQPAYQEQLQPQQLGHGNAYNCTGQPVEACAGEERGHLALVPSSPVSAIDDQHRFDSQYNTGKQPAHGTLGVESSQHTVVPKPFSGPGERQIISCLQEESRADFFLQEPAPRYLSAKKVEPMAGSQKGLLCLFRHSFRLDTQYLERGHLEITGQMPSQKLLSTGRACDKELTCVWPDYGTRPYDPPICDMALPEQSAEKLLKYKFSIIVSSPFRRCLQTAGIIARKIGLTAVYIDNRLGEDTAQVNNSVTYPFTNVPMATTSAHGACPSPSSSHPHTPLFLVRSAGGTT